ncbi:MAG: hypothetical protein AAGK21_09775 [Bacteroidota bacterium]
MSPVLTLAAAQLRADLRHRRTGRRNAGRLATTALAYAFSGGVLALSLAGATPERTLFVAASFGMVLATFGVVGSYDELMGRPRDNAWLTTLPASEGAHYGARVLGIAVYVALMAIGVAIPIGLGLGLMEGLGTALVVGAGVAGAIAWTALASLLVLWSLTLLLAPRPFRWTIGIVRTLLIGTLVIGFQLVGAQAEALGASWWPATWMADAFSGRLTTGLVLLAVSITVFGVAFGRVFPRRYFRLLRRLADGARSDGSRLRLGRRLTAPERWTVRQGPVRAAYGFAAAAFADDRIVRGRLWPAALLPIGFVVFGWIGGGLGSLVGYGEIGVIAGTLDALQTPETQLHLSVLVVLTFCLQTLVQTVQQSDHADAAWVFDTIPDARPRVVQLGAQKALAWRVLFPVHVGVAVMLTATMPAVDAILHAAFWYATSSLATRFYALTHDAPPFSRASDKFDAARRFVPLVVSIPLGVSLMMMQVAALATRARGVAIILGLLALSAVIGELVTRWPVGRRSPSRASDAESALAPQAAPAG